MPESQLVSIIALLSGGSDIITSDHQWWRPRAKVASQRSTLQNENVYFCLIFFKIFWLSSVSYSCTCPHIRMYKVQKVWRTRYVRCTPYIGPQGCDYRAGVSRGTLSVHALSGRGSADEKPTHIDVGHTRFFFCICMVRSVTISPFMHHVVTSKIGTRSQGLTRQNKKERGRSNPADWCWSRGAVDRQFRLFPCELIR